MYCPGTTKRRIKEAVIKSAASAASLGFAGERQDDGPACGRRGTGRSPANPREAALAAELITASLIRLSVVPGQYLFAASAANKCSAVHNLLWRADWAVREAVLAADLITASLIHPLAMHSTGDLKQSGT